MVRPPNLWRGCKPLFSGRFRCSLSRNTGRRLKNKNMSKLLGHLTQEVIVFLLAATLFLAAAIFLPGFVFKDGLVGFITDNFNFADVQAGNLLIMVRSV